MAAIVCDSNTNDACVENYYKSSTGTLSAQGFQSTRKRDGKKNHINSILKLSMCLHGNSDNWPHIFT